MILVTGGTGFLGGYLLRALVEGGWHIRATYRAQSQFSMIADIKDQIEWVECDLIDLPALEEAMEGVDYVYHAAAVVSFNKKEERWMMHTNVTSTRNIVNCCLAFDVKKLVFVSSISTLGRRMSRETINEQASWESSRHNTIYGVSKFRSEREVWRGIAEGLQAVMVNPTVIMGAGNWREGTPQMFRAVYHGLPAVPKGITGFVDVRDVANITIQLMNSDITAERFILNSESLSYPALFSLIAKSLGKKPPSLAVNRWQGIMAAYAEIFISRLTGSKPRIELEYARNFGKEYYYQNDKIRQALDYEFIPLARTIQQTGRVFLENYPQNKPGMLSFKRI